MSITEQIKGIVMGKKKEKQIPAQVVEHQHHWVRTPAPPKTFSQKIESLSKKADKFARKTFQPTKEPKNNLPTRTSGTELVNNNMIVPAGGRDRSGYDIPQNPPIRVKGGVARDVPEPPEAKKKSEIPITQKMFGSRQPGRPSMIEDTASAVGKAAGAVGTFAKGRKVSETVQRIKESKAVTGALQWYGEQARHYKEITPSVKHIKATARKRQQAIAATAGGFMAFMGQGQDPYYTPIKGTKQKLGRKISKKEAKRLQKLFGENWQSKLRRTSKGYYAQPTPADIAQARKERKLTERAVDFGHGFESMRTGMEVSLTSDMGEIVGDRERDDPFDIDARFGGASAGLGIQSTSRKPKNKYDINANFNTGGLRL